MNIYIIWERKRIRDRRVLYDNKKTNDLSLYLKMGFHALVV